MTTPVPIASARGKSRFGFLISAAAKVTLAHASAENSAPTIAAPNTPADASENPPWPGNARALPKLARIASAFGAIRHPSTMISNNDKIFALVKEFCSHLPRSSPRRFAAVSIAITAIAPARSPDNPAPPRPIHKFDPNTGQITPANLAKATATAAIVPVCMTSSSVQPNMKAHIPPYASRR